MKRAALALTLILVLSFVVFGVEVVKVAEPQPLFSPEIKIVSPTNTTYRSGMLTLEISVTAYVGGDTNFSMAYSLDGKNNETLPIEIELGEPKPFVEIISGSVNLPELPEGPHNIFVYEKCDNSNTNKFVTPYPGTVTQYYESAVYFTIDDGAAPIVSALSPENKTYSQNDLASSFTVDEPTSWIGYSLDGQANVTVTENFTLTELPYGSHTLTLYANDTVGNMGASKTINFSVVTPFPTTLVAVASVASASVVCLGLLVYFKKRKH